MKLCSIASGSSGNCIYVGSATTNLLIDVGISGKKIEQGLESIQVEPKQLHGVFVTHEHSDHISGLGVIARRYHVPIYATAETINAILHTKSVGKIPQELFQIIEPDDKIKVGDITVKPFSMSHDASNPVCYTFTRKDKKVGVATDLGKYDETIVKNLKKCNAVLLEANHDLQMLQVGPYPYVLKKRIMGDLGHLSNDNSGRLICEIYHTGLKHVILGHLSKDNNYPELAYETVKYELNQFDKTILKSCELFVAEREVPSKLVTIK